MIPILEQLATLERDGTVSRGCPDIRISVRWVSEEGYKHIVEAFSPIYMSGEGPSLSEACRAVADTYRRHWQRVPEAERAFARLVCG